MAESIYPIAGVDYPSRLAELRSWFPADADCVDYLEWLRWPDGFVCPVCGTAGGWRGGDGRWRCQGCGRRVSVTAGTVFQGTRTPLTVWFEAVWLMAVPKNGVSALTLSRVLPVGSYQTAWAMLAKLRSAMSSADKERLCGEVEVDEWFHGGVAKGGSALTGKDLVVAAVERRAGGRGFGRARLGVVASRSAWELRKFVRARVEPGSRVVTDGLSAYPAALAGYVHEPLNESAPGAPEAHMLLPGVHRVFSLAERWLLGTHQGGVQPGHLQEYLDEFCFRWNRRGSRHRGLVFYRLLQHAAAAPRPHIRTLCVSAPPSPPSHPRPRAEACREPWRRPRPAGRGGKPAARRPRRRPPENRDNPQNRAQRAKKPEPAGLAPTTAPKWIALTSGLNLQPLCKRCHQLKTHHQWEYTHDPTTGITTITTPTGHHTHIPPPLLQ